MENIEDTWYLGLSWRRWFCNQICVQIQIRFKKRLLNFQTHNDFSWALVWAYPNHPQKHFLVHQIYIVGGSRWSWSSAFLLVDLSVWSIFSNTGSRTVGQYAVGGGSLSPRVRARGNTTFSNYDSRLLPTVSFSHRGSLTSKDGLWFTQALLRPGVVSFFFF